MDVPVDGFCERAFHQQCVVPPVREEDIPPGDEGWLCPLCDARVDCFFSLNMDFELALDPASASWVEVFPETAALDARGMGPGQPNEEGRGVGAAAGEEEWPDDEEEDSDFAAGDASDDGADDEDEPLSGSAYSGSDSESDDGDSGSRKVRDAMNAEPEVLQGKRRRTAVDYRKLNDEMFGDGEAFEGEKDDETEGGWGPTSPMGTPRSTGKKRQAAGAAAAASGKKRKRTPTAAAAAAVSPAANAKAKKKGKAGSKSASAVESSGKKAGAKGKGKANVKAKGGAALASVTPRRVGGGGGGAATPKSTGGRSSAARSGGAKTASGGGSGGGRGGGGGGRFPDEVRSKLETKFGSVTHPSAEEAEVIGQPLGLNAHQVKVWFMNRRNRGGEKKRLSGGGD